MGNVLFGAVARNGAFVLANKGTIPSGTNYPSDFSGQEIAFDASLYNPIYGNSNTVQPKSVTALYFIKY